MPRAVAIVAIALLCAVMSGCGGQPQPVASTPLFSSEEAAFAAAEETYRSYVDALNQVDLSDPETFEEVYAWTTGELNAEDRKNFSQMHADSWTVSGQSEVIVVLPRTLGGDPPQVDLAVCVDVGAVQVVDASGASVVSPNRPGVQSTLVSLAQSQSPTGWLISNIVGRDGEPACD